MKTAAWVVSSVALFLASAKAHGRELRLERVAAGIDRVVFGGTNPPFVEALWSAERRRFWIAMPIASLVLGVVLRMRGQPMWASVLGGLSFGSALAFSSLGVWSLARASGARDDHLGSLVWWAVVLVTAAVWVSVLPTPAHR